MTVWAKVIAVVVIGAVLGLIGYEWLQEHDARMKAESVQQQKDAQIADLQKQKAANDQQLAATVAQLEAARKVPATPQQIVIDASKLIPGLPQPLQAAPAAPVAPGQASGAGAAPEAPAAPGVIIPAADLQSIKNYGITCQENAAKLTACQLDTTASAEQLKDMTGERDQWKAAAKGGTFWHRAAVAGKWIVIGAATGYVAGKVVK